MNKGSTMFARAIIILLTLLVGCGSPNRGKSPKKGGNDDTANNQSVNNENNENNDGSNNTAASCGDGVLDAGELCDPAKSDGAGVCPTSCEAPACATATLVGSAAECTAQCIVEPLACNSGDGCCPEGCDATTDSDCGNTCGDAVVEAPETCDGNCPTECNDGNACTADALVGSAVQCSARCSFEPISACANGDGCCPSGCTAERDNDCAPVEMCGNGVVDAGELCDGNCPSSCNDGNVCTMDRLTGSASTCDAQCTSSPINACANGDGCCPAGCTSANDNDCACVPKTCAQLGAECGSVDNGCNQTISCTNTCSSIEVCSGTNRCVEENFIGQDCNDYPDCGSSQDAACLLPPGWPGGYCSIICNSQTGNTSCPSGSHCTDFDGTNSLCMLNCTSDAQCESGYVCEQWDGVGGRECVPPEPPPGSGQIGDGCSVDNDCSAELFCETSSTDSNGNTTTYPGGICTQGCIPLLQQCPVGATCTLDGLCMQTCQSDNECRVGWWCGGLTSPIGNSYCSPL